MIVLASASPRREELLKKIVSQFKTCPSDVNENIPDNINVIDVAEFLAVKKAKDILQKYPNDLIIGSDTVIVYNDKIYGKPKDIEDARKMLQLFSNNTHYVITGVCVMTNNKSISFTSINEVEFYKLEEKEIEEYLSFDEYKDKAGSYAIQGKGNLFVKCIKGDFNSIIGLPISRLNRVLKNF